MFYWVAKNSGQMEISQNRSPLFCCSVNFKKTNFTAKSQLLYMGSGPLTRKRKQNKNPIFIFKSVRVRLGESVRLLECVNIEFDWEVKQGFEKASVSRAVRLRERPLAES